jgi:cytochrome c
VESLDRFLEDPFKAVPRTRMGYAGVKNPQERADLIAFLAGAEPCRIQVGCSKP